MKPWHLGLVIAAAILLAVLWLLRAVDAQRPKGTDAAQIRALIAACDRAAARRDGAGVNHYLSNDYKDSLGLRADQARAEVARVLGSAREVQVYIPQNSESIVVEPDRHHASARFDLQLQISGGQSGGLSFHGALTLSMKKEPVRYFLVFPGEEWRIIAAEGYTPGFFE